MKKAYLEPSAFNWMIDNIGDPQTANRLLLAAGYQPNIAPHVIYELARTFLNTNNIERGQILFKFIFDMEPSISAGSDKLFARELTYFRSGVAVLPFMNHHNYIETRMEIGRLATGFASEAKLFIEQMDSNAIADHKKRSKYYISLVEEKLAQYPDALKGIRSFEAAIAAEMFEMPEMIQSIYPGKMSHSESRYMSERLDEFPAIRSGAMTEMYLRWICISQKAIPSRDAGDDMRQIVEAAYCNAIVSNDKGLLARVPKINPSLEPISVVFLLGK